MKNVEISTEEYERLKDLENKRKMAQNQRNKHISENYKRASITIKNELYNKIKSKYSNNITLNGYVNNLINKDINNIDVNAQSENDLEAKNKPFEDGERVQVQMTAKLRDEILLFSDDISEYIKNAVYDRLNFDHQNVQNAQISPETLADDNLSMQKEKPPKKADDPRYTKPWDEMTEEERGQLPPLPRGWSKKSRYNYNDRDWFEPLPFD